MPRRQGLPRVADEARLGLWRGHRVEVIPYGVPPDIFHPVADKREQRRQLGISPTGFLAVVASATLGDRRKGLAYLLDALRDEPPDDLSLALVGNASEAPVFPGLRSHYLGFVSAKDRLADLYGCADLLIHPAPVDNLPNVVLEAMACGTPTVAFPVGGLPDMVREGRTGWLATELSSAALRAAIERALTDLRAGLDMKPGCLEVARDEYSVELQARRYVDLFRQACGV